MDSKISLNADHVANDQASKQLVQDAAKLFIDRGAVWLENVFAPEIVTGLATAFNRRYVQKGPSGLARKFETVGHRRLMVTVEVRKPFDDPRVFANATIMRLLSQLLGPQFCLMSYGAVVAFPNADAQPAHLDHPPLFEDPQFSASLPPYAITVVIPLTELNQLTGSTALREGSHKASDVRDILKRLADNPTLDGSVFPCARVGDAYLMDYRLIHGGMANDSSKARSIVYLVYSRPWFRDCVNFNEQPPVLISKETLKQLSPDVRHLFYGVSKYAK